MGQLATGLLSLSGWAALALLFMLPALEAPAFLGLVVPGELALLLGGVLAHQDRIPLAAALAVGVAGAVAGDSAGYWIGRRWVRACSPRAWAAGSARPASTRPRVCCCGAAAGLWSWAAAPPAPGSCSPAWPACWGCATGPSRPGPGWPRPSGRRPMSCSAMSPVPAGARSTSHRPGRHRPRRGRDGRPDRRLAAAPGQRTPGPAPPARRRRAAPPLDQRRRRKRPRRSLPSSTDHKRFREAVAVDREEPPC